MASLRMACGAAFCASACTEPYEVGKSDDAGVSDPAHDGAPPEIPDGGDSMDGGIVEEDASSGDAATLDGATTPGSCKELKATKPSTASGPSTINVGGTNVPVYCDMTTDGGGWTLVFRLSAGVTGEPYSLYTGGALNDTTAAEATLLATTKHYVSRIVGRWNLGFSVSEARVRLLNTTGGTLAEVVFNATTTGNEDWFTRNRVTKSPWTDLASAGHFTLVGYGNLGRRFYINKAWTTCDADEGWLQVMGPNPAQCANYEVVSNDIRIMYSKGPTAKRWSTGVEEARSFAILVR